ncbi:MAG: hypothetical protein WCF23_21325 [Candidatus Nitrosopolaris sp.]
MTNRTIVAIVVDDSVCSVDVQKQQINGTPHKKVVKQENILKDSETSAAYCVVAVSGTCWECVAVLLCCRVLHFRTRQDHRKRDCN